MNPIFLDKKELNNLIENESNIKILDNIDLYIEELFDIENPSKKDIKNKKQIDKYTKNITNGNLENWGTWVYYSWLGLCVHIPPKNEFRMLRTSRNRNLITEDEQLILYSSCILIAGMSVGSNIVEALVSQGIATKLILADMDIIEPTNLNRIRSPIYHIGLHKVDAISRKIWEIDPFIEIVPLYDGINKDNLNSIFENHSIDIVIDEMDNLGMKLALRETSKKFKLPVIMAADDGDNSLIDVERYDLHPNLKYFSGLIPNGILDKIKKGNMPRQEIGMMIGKYFVGPEHTPLRMFKSVLEVGKSLPSWPQLGGAAALSGISLAYISKKILLGLNVKEGRTLISLDEKLTTTDEEENKELAVYRKMIEEL